MHSFTLQQPGKKEQLDGTWQFVHGKRTQSEVLALPSSAFSQVTLPHDWSTAFPFRQQADTCGSGGYAMAGEGWYIKDFTVTPGLPEAALLFDGVYMNASIWLNGHFLGRHIYGYTPFSFSVSPFLQTGNNRLMVHVDNSAQPGSRWYSGSGITRPVWLMGTGKSRFGQQSVFITTPCIENNRAELMVQADISATESKNLSLRISVKSPMGETCASASRAIQNGIASVSLSVEEPLLWDINTPALYALQAELFDEEQLTDSRQIPFGIRSIAFSPETGFSLNGQQVKLNGVCLHHDAGCLGAAVPVQVWKRRLKTLKDMGCNSLRFSHNPPDPGLLDLCDTMGFLVMDEAFDEWGILKAKEFGTNTHESKGYSQHFHTCHREDLEAMLLRDRNHPSIIIWSIGNEVPEQVVAGGEEIVKELRAICQALDPTRPTTQACDQIQAEPRKATDAFLNELDIVGYNYVGRWRTRAETFYAADKIANPQWKMIGTENPSYGGVRGDYAVPVAPSPHRLPYYAKPVETGKLLRFTMTHDYIMGDYMWTGIDYLGEAHWPDRSSSCGVLDTAGFPKDGYYFYKSIWNRDVPMVYLLPHWNLSAKPGTIVPVLCYTTCTSAELFLNGKSYGKKAYLYPAYGMTEIYGHFDRQPVPANTDDLFLSWDVPFEAGKIQVVGYDQDGIQCAVYTLETAGAPHQIALSLYQQDDSILQIELSVRDRENRLMPTASLPFTIELEGPAEILGIDNGRPDSLLSFKGPKYETFNGLALLILRRTAVSGDITVRLVSPGIKTTPLHIPGISGI